MKLVEILSAVVVFPWGLGHGRGLKCAKIMQVKLDNSYEERLEACKTQTKAVSAEKQSE